MIFKAYKYRLYPTDDQKRKIDHAIAVCRLVYNLALEVKITAFKSGVKLNGFDLCYQLVELKKEFPWIADVDSQAVQAAVKKVDIAFKNFYKGSGYPNFKSKRKSRQSFQCPTHARRVDWSECTLTIPKIKNIPVILSRRFYGKIKTITISKVSTGKYFASILVETKEVCEKPKKAANAIGIDLGIATFVTLSTGEKIGNSRYLKSSLNRLAVLQKRAAKKGKGSANQKKAYRKVATIHERITNQRQDMLHKVSTRLIRDNQTDTICVETLAVKNMIKNRRLSQAIGDVSWSEFIRQLEYKGKWYGKNIIKIDRFYASSKTCSNCGHVLDQLNLSIREWVCEKCNVTHDRDINAAINIKNSGLGKSGEPVEQSALMGCDEAGIIKPMKSEVFKKQMKLF